MALLNNRKQNVQPIGVWPTSGGPMNFDDPIPTNQWNTGTAPATLQPKPQVNPSGGFSNPRVPPSSQPIAPTGTPMLASHGAPPPVGVDSSVLNADDATQNAFAVAQKQRRPLTTAAATVPAIGQTAQPGGGIMSVEGGGNASIDAQGNINRGKNWDASDGGSLSVLPASPIASVQGTGTNGQGPPIGGASGDKWSFLEDGSALGTAKAGIARKLGYVPIDYDQNPGKYDAIIAGQGANYDRNAQEVPVAAIGAEAHKYAADQGLAGTQATAGAHIQAAEITAEGNKRSAVATARQKLSDDGTKDHKEMIKTFYNHIKDLELPQSWAGKHMDIAKQMALAQDPNYDYGIYYNPATPDREGIGAKKTDFEPLLNRYLQAGYPASDAHARAFADLQAAGKSQGRQLYEPIPNLERFRNKNLKPAEEIPGIPQ